MTDRIQISGATDLWDLRAFVQENKGKMAYAVGNNDGFEIYVSDRADAKPDTKALGNAMGKSAVSPQGQALARRALYISISNTYGKAFADYVDKSICQDLMAPDARLSDLVDKATAKINSLFQNGLNMESELYLQQKAILNEVELAAKAKAATSEKEAPKDPKSAPPHKEMDVVSDESPAPAFGPSLPPVPPIPAQNDEDEDNFDEEEPPLLLVSGNFHTAGLVLDEDDDDDDESEAVVAVSQQAQHQAKSLSLPAGVNGRPVNQAEQSDESDAADATVKMKDLPADLEREQDRVDDRQDTSQERQAESSKAQQ